jgi:prephenate dehydrogenase
VIQELAIVGVGLLGGSVAKAARADSLARRIVGVGRDAARLQPALDDGTLDAATTDLAAGVRKADFILLAAPVLAIEGLLAQVSRVAPEGSVVTDVGSTKRNIVRAAERLAVESERLAAESVRLAAAPAGCGGRPPSFVGSHPMAGSEQSGYRVARADLFRGATVVVTPTERTALGALKQVTEFWEALGARVCSLDPETHDRAVAAISHLPHLIACALVDGVRRVEPAALELAARGFRDTTRIAAGDPDMWTEIFVANRDALSAGVAAFRDALAELQRTIDGGDAGALRAALDRIKTIREGLR